MTPSNPPPIVYTHGMETTTPQYTLTAREGHIFAEAMERLALATIDLDRPHPNQESWTAASVEWTRARHALFSEIHAERNVRSTMDLLPLMVGSEWIDHEARLDRPAPGYDGDEFRIVTTNLATGKVMYFDHAGPRDQMAWFPVREPVWADTQPDDGTDELF